MTLKFSPRRFWRTLVWTLNYQWRTLLTLFTAAVTVFALFQCFGCIQGRNNISYHLLSGHSIEIIIASTLEQIGSVGLAVGACLLCVGASIAFRHLHSQNEGRRLLMLPASPLEKFLARWILYVPMLFVLLVVAFMVGDVLRVLIWPLFGYDVSFPSAIPAFFTLLKYLFFITPANQPLAIIIIWAMFLFFHALSLFCSVYVRRMAWLFVLVAFFVVTGLILNGSNKATELHVWEFVVPAVVLAVGSYWLFCRYPQYQLFHHKID